MSELGEVLLGCLGLIFIFIGFTALGGLVIAGVTWLLVFGFSGLGISLPFWNTFALITGLYILVSILTGKFKVETKSKD